VQVNNNSGDEDGPPSVVGGNTIHGNLQSQGNTPPPGVTNAAFGTNNVSGNKQGQCAGL
jgi:hypothetical protein